MIGICPFIIFICVRICHTPHKIIQAIPDNSVTQRTMESKQSGNTVNDDQWEQRFSDMSFEKIQRERIKIISDACKLEKRDFTKNRGRLNFYLDDKRKRLYCLIPKAACTSWKRGLGTLVGFNHTVALEELQAQGHLAGRLNFSQSFYVHEKEYLSQIGIEMHRKTFIGTKRWENYTKILVVRDPFVRLCSAYLDKIHSG